MEGARPCLIAPFGSVLHHPNYDVPAQNAPDSHEFQYPGHFRNFETSDELENHSLIFAEDSPAETFVDGVDRLIFDNWAEHEALFPDGKPINELPYPRTKARKRATKLIAAR